MWITNRRVHGRRRYFLKKAFIDESQSLLRLGVQISPLASNQCRGGDSNP